MSPQKFWVRGRGVPPKCKLRPWEKKLLQGKADELIETHFKPQYVQTPKNQQWNYVVGFFTHWHGAYLYFEARYACPSPDAISPFSTMPLPDSATLQTTATAFGRAATTISGYDLTRNS